MKLRDQTEGDGYATLRRAAKQGMDGEMEIEWNDVRNLIYTED